MACASATVSTRGSLAGTFTADGAPGLRLALGQVMQERLPPAPPPGQLPGPQQLPDIGTLTRLMGIERYQRRQLPVNRRGAHVRPADGSTATSPARPAGGNASQATYCRNPLAGPPASPGPASPGR